jgi:hypothetical protein
MLVMGKLNITPRRLLAVLVYEGNVLDALRESKTECPFQLLPDGNTELTIPCAAFFDESEDEFRLGQLKEALLASFAIHGKIISHRISIMRKIGS